MKWRFLGFWFGLSLSFSACSSSKQESSNGGNSCVQAFNACGGSLVGT